MRGLAILALPILLAVANAQPTQKSADEQRHFRWSERAAHEISYKHTIRSAPELSPTERKMLIDSVFERFKQRQIMNDPMFDDTTEERLRKLASDTRIELIELGDKGSREVLAQGNGLGNCGATGNCIFWVFHLSPEGTKLLLEAQGFEKVLVRPWSTNGYRDIVLSSHESAMERYHVWYKYSDGSYRKAACYMWVTSYGPDVLPSPEVSQVKCGK
jgi:hypothetical protein